jgi:hypothetical protein
MGKTPSSKHTLSARQRDSLLAVLKNRFEANPHRHQGVGWAALQTRLAEQPAKLWSLHAMEETGGEPDVVSYDPSSVQYTFFDCALESPTGRRSLYYDAAALAARKENKPKGSALAKAAEMGIELLTEADYRMLQALGPVDTKTSSWIRTPDAIRKLGGGLFGDFRYGQVFFYHNGAESYYAARGFRGALRV